MQNKHYFFFPFWESQRSGRGGGSSRLGQNPNFYQKLVLEASLNSIEEKNRQNSTLGNKLKVGNAVCSLLVVCLTHWAAQFNDPPSSEKRPPENLHLAAAEDKTSPACYFFSLTISKYYFLFVGWWRGTNQVQGIQGSRQHVWRPWLVSQIHPSRSTRIFFQFRLCS